MTLESSSLSQGMCAQFKIGFLLFQKPLGIDVCVGFVIGLNWCNSLLLSAGIRAMGRVVLC